MGALTIAQSGLRKAESGILLYATGEAADACAPSTGPVS
jgi:hypothetical protein